MTSAAPALAKIVVRLNRARLRLIAQGVLHAALGALGAGLAIFALLELLRRLALLPNAVGSPSSTIVAAAAAAVILTAGIALAILRAPPIEQLARRADRTFGLRERIATALEIEGRPAASRPLVVTAMLADAVRHGGAINPAALVAFRLPHSTVLVPLAAIAAAVVMMVPPQSAPAPIPAETTLSATIGAGERALMAEDITRIAGLIEAEAASHGDAYMQAVATTLDDLGERVALAPEMTRGEILGELGTLLDYATAAGSDWPGAAGERIPRLIEALEESIALPRPDQPAATPASEALAEEAAAAAPPATDPGGSGEPTQPSSGTIESVLKEMEDSNELARAAQSSEVGASTETLDYLQAAQAQAAPRAQSNTQQDAQPQMFGAQADAGAAEEQLAGDGTEPIADEAIARPVDLEATARMVVTGEDTGEGLSLDIETAPDTKLTEITDESLAAGTEAWRRTTEAAVQRYAIGIDDRDTVSRYLQALQGSAAR